MRRWTPTVLALLALAAPASACSLCANLQQVPTFRQEAEKPSARMIVYGYFKNDKDVANGTPFHITGVLRSDRFASLRGSVARRESFEIYSTARGEEAAYISLLNRSQLRLAALYEGRDDKEAARQQYQRVLDARSDDPTALAAMARLARSSISRRSVRSVSFCGNCTASVSSCASADCSSSCCIA